MPTMMGSATRSATRRASKLICHPARPATFAMMALLVALAFFGCGQPKATQAPSTVAPATTSPAAPSSSGQTGSESASAYSSGSTSTPGSVAGSASAQPSVSPPDPVASELDQINRLINDINNSISGSDASQAGGE